MRNKKQNIWIVNGLIIALFAPLLIGCSPAKKAIRAGDLEFAYNEAMNYYNQQKWSKSAELFETLSDYFAGTQREDSIMYYNGYSKFKDGQYISAIEVFEEYRRSYSRSPLLEDIEGMYTLSHYYLSPGPTRDQGMTQTTIGKIDEFTSRYPDSRNYDEFLLLREEMVNRLFDKDYMNSYTYYKIRKYKSAISALKNSLKRYPETVHRESILFYIVASNFELAENSVASKQYERYLSTIDSYYTFIAEFPESKEYKSKAEKMYTSAQKFIDRGEVEKDESDNYEAQREREDAAADEERGGMPGGGRM
ncbi:MAG: outer membrane protein assembly factor BamD [Rikenellaceae bacterium]